MHTNQVLAIITLVLSGRHSTDSRHEIEKNILLKTTMSQAGPPTKVGTKGSVLPEMLLQPTSGLLNSFVLDLFPCLHFIFKPCPCCVHWIFLLDYHCAAVLHNSILF